MSDAVSQYGFTAARRGYAPEQVDRTLAALTANRDEAWERLSVLGAGLREMEKRLAEFVEAAVDAPEPDYRLLSEQAAGLAATAENEARAVRDAAGRFAEDTRDEVHQAGQASAAAAGEYATAVRAEADQATRRSEERTRAEAERLLGEAAAEARAVRDAATAHAAKVRVAAAEASERAEAKLAELRRSADETFAAAAARADAGDSRVAETAERRLREAEQYRESVLGRIKQSDAEAQAKADQVIDRARREAERINAASEQEQAEFAARHEEVQQHLDHIKGTLASLTGAAVGAIEPGRPAAQSAAGHATVGRSAGGHEPGGQAVAGRAPGAVAELVKPATVLPSDPEADTGEIAVVVDVPPVPSAPVPEPSASAPSVPESSVPESSAAEPVRSAPVPSAAPSDAATAVLPVTPAGPSSEFVPGPVSATRLSPVAPGEPAQSGEPAQGVPAEVETRIIPKIVIVDDGSDYATPHTVLPRRT